MKLFLVSAAVLAAAVVADSNDGLTDETPQHTVYNCLNILQNVDEANAMIGNGECNPEVNCGPFSYDLGDCWTSSDDICAGDSWYSNGRENFRCSTKTGGQRLGRYGSNEETGQAQSGGWPGACECYEFCSELAEEEGAELVAFDHYSGKCRCWSGTCSYDDALPCRDGGDSYGVGGPRNGDEDSENPDLGNNWRCPSEIYFPDPKTDCDGNDITFHYDNLQQYQGDGHCDNGETDNHVFAFDETDTLSFNFNCSMFDYDGGDCSLDCHQSIYWATDFVQLGNAYERLDECVYGEPQMTEFTTVCDCYEFCAGFASTSDENFLFDHDHRGNCRCFFDMGDGAWEDEPMLSIAYNTTFCGLNSDCQIYQPNRAASCDGDDYTLGVYDGGEAYDADSMATEVSTYSEYLGSMCVEDAMCMANGYSGGSCFDCTRFSTDEQQDAYCTDETSYYAQIDLTDLQGMVDDGYLQGSAADTSLGGDNCACLNFCFSKAVEMDVVESTEAFYDMLNVIAEIDFAYATRNETCACYQHCEDTTDCGASDCPTDATIWHSAVADLNTQA